MLYKEWLGEWLELYVKVSTKDRTYKKYRRQVEYYIVPLLGEYELDELTAVTLQRFSLMLLKKGLAAGTVNGIIFVLRSSLKKAVDLGVTPRQYSDAIVRPKVRAKKMTCFSKEEQKRIERYVLEHNTPYLFGIVLAMYTGLRIGELLSLTWDDIDFRAGTIMVVRSCYDSWENGHYKKVFDTPKTLSSERVIPVPKSIIGKLKLIRNRVGAHFVVAAKSEYGAQVRLYQKSFQKVLNKLNIKPRGFHSLRHTFATRALEIGMDIRTLSEILGHRNPTITLQRYAHSFMEHKQEMMNKIGKLFD